MLNKRRRNDWHSKEYVLKFPKFWRKVCQKKLRKLGPEEELPSMAHYRKTSNGLYFDYDPYW